MLNIEIIYKDVKRVLALMLFALGMLVSVATFGASSENEVDAIVYRYQEKLHQLKIESKKGNSNAQYELAREYEINLGDYSAAIHHYEMAAKAGNSGAMYYIGRLYEQGWETEFHNYPKAFHWYLKSAKSGDERAQFKVAGMYLDGKGTVRNYIEAYVWYSICSARGYMEGTAREIMDEIENRMPSIEILEAQKIADERLEQIQQMLD